MYTSRLSFQRTALRVPLTHVAMFPLSFFNILVQYLVAFHACHGELFHTHWLFVGTDHQTKHVRWNNCPWKFLIAAPFRVLLLFELWHAAVACLKTRSYKCSPENRKVCKFWYQIFYVSLEYTAERLLFLFTHDHESVYSSTKIYMTLEESYFEASKRYLWGEGLMTIGESHFSAATMPNRGSVDSW